MRGTMRRVWTLGLLDLRLVVADRPAAFWMIVLPVFLMWMFGHAFGPGVQGRPAVALAVATADRGPLGASLVGELEGEGIKVTRVSPDSLAKDRRSLTIPANFTESVLARRQVAVTLSRTEGGSRDFDQAAQVHVWKAIARFLGNLILVEKRAGAPASAVPDLPARYAEVAARPSRVVVRSEDAGRGRPVPGGLAQSVPGTLTMSILMMTMIYGAAFLTLEKTQGMLRRQGTLPISRRALLSGKLLGRLMIALTQIAVLLAVGRFLFQVDWGPSPGGLALLVVAFAAASASFGLLFGELYRTPEQAGATGWIAPLVMAAMGGCWWPLEVVPSWMRAAGHLFPTAWAMDGFHRLISFGEGIGAVWGIALILFGYAVGATALAVRFIRWD